MTFFNKTISLDGTRRVFRFYRILLALRPLSAVMLVLSGLATRVLSVGVFVLIVKVFLTILDPNSSAVVVNAFINDYFEYEVHQDVMIRAMLIGLSALLCCQYFISKFNLWLFLKTKEKIVHSVLKTPLNEHKATHIHICLDYIPMGLDGALKCIEICLFYGLLVMGIFVINPLLGMLLLIVAPLLLMILVMNGRKEVYVVREIRELRQQVNEPEEAEEVIKLGSKQYSFIRASIINSEFFGGFAIVIMMLLFMLWFDQSKIESIAALVLVFSVRFAVIYTGELSRHLGRLLQQRIILTKVSNRSYV